MPNFMDCINKPEAKKNWKTISHSVKGVSNEPDNEKPEDVEIEDMIEPIEELAVLMAEAPGFEKERE